MAQRVDDLEPEDHGSLERTKRSASRCNVQRVRPAGGGLCATASSSRSTAGVQFPGRKRHTTWTGAGPVRLRQGRTPSRHTRGGARKGGVTSPRSTKRRRSPCTVFACTSKASPAAASVHAGPSAAALHHSHIAHVRRHTAYSPSSTDTNAVGEGLNRIVKIVKNRALRTL